MVILFLTKLLVLELEMATNLSRIKCVLLFFIIIIIFPYWNFLKYNNIIHKLNKN